MNIKLILFTSLFLLHGSWILAQNNYEILLIEGKYEELIKESASGTDSASISWHAIGLDKTGETLKAISHLQKGLAYFPDSPWMESLLANLLYKTGQISLAKPLLIKYQDDPGTFMKLVRTFELESNNKEAIVYLEERIKSDSLNAEYWARLGDNYNEIDFQLNAIRAYKEAKAINPDDQVVLAKLANLYLKIKDFTKCIAICDEALKINAADKTIMRIKGHAYYRTGSYRQSMESFKFLFEKGDSSLVVLKYLGISESNIYYYENSRDHLHLAYAQDTTDYEICYFLGRAYLNSSTPDSGLYYLDLAELLIQPRPVLSAAIIIEKTAIFAALDQYDEALEGYKLAYKISPKPEYLFHMASIFQHKLKDKKTALKYYQDFLSDLPPSNTKTRSSGNGRLILNLKTISENNIEKLREELFFQGELE